MEETPAQRAGLKTGDIIVKVNSVVTKGLDLKEVANEVRGKQGTKVNLTIQRKKAKLVKNITREKIKIRTVKHKKLKNNLLYIKISSFISHDTSYEVASVLKQNKDANGLIIDLRGNNGGLLPNAIYIANMFLKDGIIVSIVDKNGVREDIEAQRSSLFANKPVVVIVNQGSASASEILSAALKENNIAVLVGEKTYGKGVVQKIHELPDGSGLNLTIAKYLTPKGFDIHEKGINPNYFVEFSEADLLNNNDPQLDKAKEVALKLAQNTRN